MLVPPPATESVPAAVGVKVNAPEEFVIDNPCVMPLSVTDDVAKVIAPVCALPPPSCCKERRPVLVMDGDTPPTTVKEEQLTPDEHDADEVATERSPPVPFPYRSCEEVNDVCPVP